MKKRMLPIILTVCLLAGILAGCCQNEDVVENTEAIQPLTLP